MIEYHMTIKPISLNMIYKNARRGRVKTDEYKGWVILASNELRKQKGFNIDKITGPYSLYIRVGRKETKADIDNLIKPISDVLVAIGATPDDRNMVGVDIAYVQGMTGTQIRILET